MPETSWEPRLADLPLLPYDQYVKQLPRKSVSAGVLIRDSAGRVLLVEPSYKPGWEIPGGVVEDGESPWVTAARELTEEIGLIRPRGRLLVVDYVPAEDDGMPDRLAFVFDGGRIEPAEVAGLRFGLEIVNAELCDDEQLRARVTPVLAERLATALDAANKGEPIMCERGKPS
jgi:8-oxo-dGTP pyrophosphatase MutT (NUDIX family)